jgi:hypothetical protein
MNIDMEYLKEKITQSIEKYIEKLQGSSWNLSNKNPLFEVNKEKSTIDEIILNILDSEKYAELISPAEETFILKIHRDRKGSILDENNKPIK